ncbi:MAG: translocation/assembly module TamB domain-containing protein [Verrucomicrobiota bacterium]
MLGLAISILAILIAAAPLWFPWILPSVFKKYGVRYSHYERDGYSRFILRNVIFAQPKIKFQAKRVEILFPTTLLWRNFGDDRRENYLRVSDWSLELLDSTDTQPKTNSVFYLSQKLDPLLADLKRWIPRATLDNGAIRFKNKVIALPVAEWAKGNLSGRIFSPQLFPETFFNADLEDKFSKRILIENPTWNVGAVFIIAEQEKNLLQLEGSVLWQSNHIDLAAQFGREGWLPDSASVNSKLFRVPAEVLKLQGYRDLGGSLDLRWATNRFTVDLTASAQPIENKEVFLSPVEAVIHASGDTNSVLVETATISSPWLQAKLSKNVEFSFRGELLSEAATLSLAADLSEQHWIAATGILNGVAILRRGTNRFPDTTFTLAGAGIDISEIQTEQLDVQGELDWPWLRIDSASVRFKDANAQANLKFNAVTRLIADGNLKLDGHLGREFLPPEISYKKISLNADFSGSLKKLLHSAHVELKDAKFPGLAPLGIVADWRGTHLDLESLQAKISSTNSALVFSGSANVQTDRIDARVEKLTLMTQEQSVLSLQKPIAISSMKNGSSWTATIEPLRWLGEKTEISLAGNVQWPQQGDVSLSTTQFNFSVFQDFSERPLPSVLIERLNAVAKWTNGPVNFSFEAFARFFSRDGTPFLAELQALGNAKGTTIELANVGTKTETVISGKGFLPMTILPGSSNLLQTIPKGSVDFRAETIPNTQFWEELASLTQTTFREPRVSIVILGTVDAPQGKISASAKEIILKPKAPDQPIPRFQNLFADFDLVREHVTLNRFEVFVEGQPITATGELPLPKILERDWKKVFDWRKANAHLKIIDAQIAPFERLFPTILSPLGTMNLDVTIVSGGKLDGELRVENAALRPIPSLGPIHDIKARLKLAGTQLKLETFEGFLGGEAVNLSGEINLAKYQSTNLPAFNFKLTGTNVPLARSPDFILRSDIDLGIANKQGGVPVISGALNLRDSFYLSDLKLLIPGKVAKPKNRPPYFSVETEPLANWHLNIAVRGENSLKVRSPLFRGELSANLKLDGTLKEPIALGDARINSGVIQFPFANLRVDQGFISLTSDNPYRPHLSVSASSRTFGYDVKMEVSGPADKPNIEFSSNPGLTSEQILLMVTAGELPRDEINFSTQQKAGRLAFFLGKNLMSKFGSNDARDDKLEIRSGENVSEQGRQTYYLEYKLTDDWSIVGEYDRFGGLNAGFKWKFFSK